MRRLSLCLVSAVLLSVTACHRSAPQVPSNRPDRQTVKEGMLHYNQQRSQAERQTIEAYLDTASGTFVETDDGYWYCTDQAGQGDSIRTGQTVRYAYRLELLDGTVCESTAGRKAACVEVGRRQQVKGLDLAFEQLQNGSEARILLPSHLAFGIQGKDHVPEWTPVLYRIKIIATE
ncbi:MAG: FKBP-type peptidyl-prolyl cis-trans isomerase [Paludibacteraceae bacterium]|nr:FKBP-type peptidyl-prolyl cis-trans isomerase [Paludibacteraceae bacterium]